MGLPVLLIWILIQTYSSAAREDVVPAQSVDCPTPSDIALLLDTSRGEQSDDADRWELLQTVVAQLVQLLPLSPGGTRIALISFASSARVLFDLSEFVEKAAVIDAVLQVERKTGNASIEEAIRTATEEVFHVSGGARAGVRDVILLVTSSRSFGEVDRTLYQSRAAKRAGLDIYTVGIGGHVNENELHEISSDPITYYSMHVPDKLSLTTERRKQFVENICGGPAVPTPRCDMRSDLVFLVDSSGSIKDQNPPDGSYDNWVILKDFVLQIIDSMDVSSEGTRVGLVQYASEAEVIKYFDEDMSLKDTYSVVKNLEHTAGGTNIAGAIKAAREKIFRSSRGDREGVPNVAILITDGVATVNHYETLSEAEAAKKAGIRLFTVGITNGVDERELQRIASEPVKYHYFNSTSIQQIAKLLSRLIILLCEEVLCQRPTANVPQDMLTKKCKAARLGKCTDGLQLQWRRHQNRLLVGFNDLRVPNIDSAAICQMYCMQDSHCRSIDYAKNSAECAISRSQQQDNDQYFTRDPATDYYEWTCVQNDGTDTEGDVKHSMKHNPNPKGAEGREIKTTTGTPDSSHPGTPLSTSRAWCFNKSRPRVIIWAWLMTMYMIHIDNGAWSVR